MCHRNSMYVTRYRNTAHWWSMYNISTIRYIIYIPVIYHLYNGNYQMRQYHFKIQFPWTLIDDGAINLHAAADTLQTPFIFSCQMLNARLVHVEFTHTRFVELALIDRRCFHLHHTLEVWGLLKYIFRLQEYKYTNIFWWRIDSGIRAHILRF